MDQAELQDADLNEEIERTLALADQRFKDRISVERDCGELPRVRCFAGQLNQVFMNLIINACDAIEGKGCIRVKTRAIDDGVRLEFADNGPGLPEELAERIFEPFFTTKVVGKGTGLGLSLSHGIIERHGGRMWGGVGAGRGSDVRDRAASRGPGARGRFRPARGPDRVSSDTTRVVRRVSGAIAVAWALFALVLAVLGQFAAERGMAPPIQTSGTGGIAMVTWLDASAARAGVERGDRVLSVDGTPVDRWLRERGWELVREGQPVHYQIQKRDGEVMAVALLPVPRSSPYQRFFVPLFFASLAVGVTFLSLGLFVWRAKPDRPESWAFLLFCSVMAMQLFSSMHTYDALWGYERMLLNLPFIGATTVHLFTTFPNEPPWLVRFPRFPALAYAIAGVLALVVFFEGMHGMQASAGLSFGAALLGCGMGLAILTREWLRVHDDEDSGSVNVVFLGAWLGFAPVLLVIVGLLFFRVSFPASIALIWLVVFPLSVAYGIVRNQLFDIRGAARSSAAYGAATLAITGLFALLISTADIAFQRFNVNASSPLFSVGFLFFAILAFNPLRVRHAERSSIVFFDRDRAGLSHGGSRDIRGHGLDALDQRDQPIGILRGRSPTPWESSGPMVLLVDVDERKDAASNRIARRLGRRTILGIRRSRSDHPHLEAPLDAPAKSSRGVDFDDDATDLETREACAAMSSTPSKVEILVPIALRRRSPGRDCSGAKALGRSPRPPTMRSASAHARQPERDRDRERQGLRRDCEAQRDARGARRRADGASCARPRPS